MFEIKKQNDEFVTELCRVECTVIAPVVADTFQLCSSLWCKLEILNLLIEPDLI